MGIFYGLLRHVSAIITLDTNKKNVLAFLSGVQELAGTCSFSGQLKLTRRSGSQTQKLSSSAQSAGLATAEAASST